MNTRITAILLIGLLSMLVLATVPTASNDSVGVLSPLTGIQGFVIVVDSLAPPIVERGITAGVLAVEVERRLRDAGLTVVDTAVVPRPEGTATVRLLVSGMLEGHLEQITYSIRLDVWEGAVLLRNPDIPPFEVVTWSIDALSVVGSDWRTRMVEDVGAIAEEFVEAYLLANAHPEG